MREWLEKRLKEVAKRATGKAELAEHLGIGAGAVTRIINGERKIQDDEFEPLADFLGWSVGQVHAANRGHKDVKNELSPQSGEDINDSSTMPEESEISAAGGGEGFTSEGLSDMEIVKDRIKGWLADYSTRTAVQILDDVAKELLREHVAEGRANPPKGA